jgi:hypothetical protein
MRSERPYRRRLSRGSRRRCRGDRAGPFWEAEAEHPDYLVRMSHGISDINERLATYCFGMRGKTLTAL